MKIKIGKYAIELSNEDKIFYPKDGITKGDVIEYYRAIAPIMFPYMKGRLISMQRFPNGIKEEGFFQKDAGSYFPSWITTKAVKRESGGAVQYVVANSAATLVYLANQGCITPHLWLSKADKLRYPDRIIFDLDPSGKDFSWVIAAARRLKEMLEEQGLVPFVMTTGSRGLHVVVPIKRTKMYPAVRTFARKLAHALAQEDPKKFTVEHRLEKRKGRVFIDYLRNGFGATGVAPYALRPLDGAPIATPLEWKEVKKGLSPQKYTITTIFRRLKSGGDPWRSIDRFARQLP